MHSVVALCLIGIVFICGMFVGEEHIKIKIRPLISEIQELTEKAIEYNESMMENLDKLNKSKT